MLKCQANGMKGELPDLLRCPQSGQRLEVVDCVYLGGRIQSGLLVSQDGRHRYPIRNFVPRFVPESNYADNFGMQWNKFRKTQLDSHSGHTISAERFWQATGWNPEDLAGHWVLDVGCCAGRFAEVALRAGARVVALDYSSAVDACYVNLMDHPNFHVLQGDVYALPPPIWGFPFCLFLRRFATHAGRGEGFFCTATDACRGRADLCRLPKILEERFSAKLLVTL